jgi:hypothetical protein
VVAASGVFIRTFDISYKREVAVVVVAMVAGAGK